MKIHKDLIKKESIIEIRNAFLLTQKDFAKKLMVSKGTVGHWESGRNIPSGPAYRLLVIFAYAATEIKAAIAKYKIHIEQKSDFTIDSERIKVCRILGINAKDIVVRSLHREI